MTNKDNIWHKDNLPIVKVPVSPVTVLHGTPFSATPEPPNNIVKIYKPTGQYDEHTDKYEYYFVRYEER